MQKYSQLTEHQRYQIYVLKKAEHNQAQIAQLLNVSASTISRELKRNTGKRGYRPKQAQMKTIQRRQSAKKYTKMTPRLKRTINDKLRQEWSPEQITGWLRDINLTSVSHQRIYDHIREDRRCGGTLYKHLRQSHKKRRKRYGYQDSRGQIKERVSIDDRPKIVDRKSRFGDWEIDTIIGKNHLGVLISIVERRSRYTLITRANSKQAEEVSNKTVDLLHPVQNLVHTITADNGKEFASHKQISTSLNADVYFAHPYHAWERGLNENTNGLIRQYFPKGSDLKWLTKQQIKKVQDRLNHRPRKCLGFKTPEQIFKKALDETHS